MSLTRQSAQRQARCKLVQTTTKGGVMALKFLGIFPDTPTNDSPTIWLDDATGDLVIQSWTADEETVTEAQRVGSIPGHSTEIPAHESMIRLPAVMRQYLPGPEGADQ
ncbi:hypothetical protein SAMN04488563_0332 [Jiangella alkaliphila]|uniref:Uncharacterized protein n=2 Tax=Jiangella alkaliphila TaxID=419479 RepID=A0A1H2G7Q1_9ACTN|nr:hypothetical protein [Jiangella alkaliphila]SDU15388.1 hypothetical protein SAMN04488563_0332 [Jiangella alkaliphila]